MKIRLLTTLIITFWITECFASDCIFTLFLKDAVSKPVYIYKSSRSNKKIAEIREDTLWENWHEVTILKQRKKRYYVSVEDIYPKGTEVRGWINKEECAVYLHQAGVQVENPNHYDYYVLRFFNKPAVREPAIVLSSYEYEVFENIESCKVSVTDVKVIDDCYPYDTWLRVLVKKRTGETMELWTADYDSNVFGTTECSPASRLQEVLNKRK